MHPHIISRRKRLISLLLGAALFPALLVYFFPKTHEPIIGETYSALRIKNQITAVLPPQEQVSFALPLRLKIPEIAVDASIEQKGITLLGDMDVPKSPDQVAWFNIGPRPGEKGNAVMSGHFGWKNGIPAVFDNLYQLHQGDKLTVEDEKGVITIFVVRELRVYGENENASDVFISSDGKAHLNLVTCQGSWNKDKKSYSERLVVFTDKSD